MPLPGKCQAGQTGGQGISGAEGIVTALVKDVMTRQVVAVKADADFKQIVIALRQYRVSACPVIDDAGKVVGVVSEADLLYKETEPELPSGMTRLRWRLDEKCKAAAVTAAELMTAPAVTTYPTAPVVDAARLMQVRGVKRLPVVTDVGQLAGIVSRVDVLTVYERPDADIFEELTTDILAGEFGIDSADVDVTIASGIVTISGRVARLETALELLKRIRHLEGVVATRNRMTVAEAADGHPVR